MDYKEYSKLRSIARKRIERAAKAGKTELVKIPTVKEVRASANPDAYMAAVKSFLANPGATLTAGKKTGVSFPKIDFVPIAPVTAAEKKARRNEQKRRSKAKRYVEKLAEDEQQRVRHVGYLKALQTVVRNWRAAGVDAANWLWSLSPKQAKAFVDYLDYRFSQGSYNVKYVIDTFVRDFWEMVKRNYNMDDIEADFNLFLGKMEELKKGKRKANKYGVTEDEVDSLWKRFVSGEREEIENEFKGVKDYVKKLKKRAEIEKEFKGAKDFVKNLKMGKELEEEFTGAKDYLKNLMKGKK